MKIGKLTFRSLDVRGRTSISGDLEDDETFGIYVYEFADGTIYVGKSINVRKRHVEHLHEWRHEKPSPVPATMLWAPLDCSERELDFAETEAISFFEQKGYSLRNVLKTGRPRGNMEVIVDTGEGFGVPIPWERENLPASKGTYDFAFDKAKKRQFERLQDICDYPRLLKALVFYVKNTIPAPADTAGKLWVATAMPATNNGKRICCISCQNAETFVVFRGEDDGDICGFINVKRNEGGKLPRWWRRKRTEYGTLSNVYAMSFHSQKQLDKLLLRPHMFDCCYRANAELMRRGVSMYGRYNNPYLVANILEAIG